MDNNELTDKGKQILSKSRELMMRYGIKSLTMDDIAQQMGISKKTLYQVVKNKADLVDKVMDMTITEQQSGIGNMEAELDNAIDEMLKIYQQHAIMIKRMNLALTFELKKYFPESWHKLENFRNDFIFKSVCRNIDKGKAKGLYRTDVHTIIIAKLYSSRVLDLINPELFPREEFLPDLLLHEMFLYHLHGIASDAGLKYLREEVKAEF
jgi:AcrR family transcriptional regulator